MKFIFLGNTKMKLIIPFQMLNCSLKKYVKGFATWD